jgi:glutamate 5-kinase
VDVADAEGRVIARGLSAYSSADVRLIMGRRSSEIEQLVGFRGRDEIVHRDDLVLRKSAGDQAGAIT